MRDHNYETIRAERVEAAKIEGDRYRALSSNENRPLSPNWWVIDSPEVGKAVRQATRKIQSRFTDLIEFDDLEDEAWIAAWRIADRAEACLNNEGYPSMGTFQHELEMDLIDILRPIANRHGKTLPHDADVLDHISMHKAHGDSRHSKGHLPSPDGEDVPPYSAWGHDFRGGSGIEWSDELAAVL